MRSNNIGAELLTVITVPFSLLTQAELYLNCIINDKKINGLDFEIYGEEIQWK